MTGLVREGRGEEGGEGVEGTVCGQGWFKTYTNRSIEKEEGGRR